MSRDEAQTWGDFKTVECGPGLDRSVTAVAPPPVKHVRVRPNAGELPERFARYHYPHLAFVSGKVVMAYQQDTYHTGRMIRRIKLRSVPESWFRG